MKHTLSILVVLVSLALTAFAENPFGLFDFNLRGDTPGEQIHSLDGIGFDGIAMPLNKPKDLVKLDAYLAAKPDLKLFALFLKMNQQKQPQLLPQRFQRHQHKFQRVMLKRLLKQLKHH